MPERDFDREYNSDFEFDRDFDRQTLKAKFWRFMRYLSTRKLECWGFFAAGYLIATIF